MECGFVHGGVIENGRAHNPLTLCSVPVLVHVQVWVHIPGDPQRVQLRNATTTTSGHLFIDLLKAYRSVNHAGSPQGIYLFIYLLKAYSPVNCTGSPQGIYFFIEGL